MQLTLFDEEFNTKSIEEEMLEKALFRGSGFVNGKKRIYEKALSKPSVSAFAEFLKNEYGIGGHGYPTREPFRVHREHHDSKGIEFRWFNADGNEIEQSHSWGEAAKVILQMIEAGTYQPEED